MSNEQESEIFGALREEEIESYVTHLFSISNARSSSCEFLLSSFALPSKICKSFSFGGDFVFVYLERVRVHDSLKQIKRGCLRFAELTSCLSQFSRGMTRSAMLKSCRQNYHVPRPSTMMILVKTIVKLESSYEPL